MKARERIIEAAIQLFNENGTGNVSTNHIAEAAGISPGNLYYHFRNKDEIIREIFQHLMTLWDRAAMLPGDGPPGVADLLDIVRRYFSILQEYPFYYRELTTLVHQDLVLAEQYRAMRAKGLANVEALFNHFAQVGVFQLPVDPETPERLARICWMLVDFSLPFAELAGVGTQVEQARKSEELVLQLFKPYLTIQALAELDNEVRNSTDDEH